MTIETTRAAMHDWIDAAYKALGEHVVGFRQRETQHQLSHALADAFVDGTPIAAEAPTGTGKTLAYLVAALGANLVDERPVFVATATKALQNQLMAKDLPQLEQAGLLTASESVLLKGRANYFCPKKAQDLLDDFEVLGDDPTAYIVDDDDAFLHVDEYRKMNEALKAKTWDGDISGWPAIVKSEPIIQTNAVGCRRTECPMFSKCPYYTRKTTLLAKKVIIVNHNLVMQELSPEVAAGVSIKTPSAMLFGAERFRLVFDEAHHVPARASEYAASQFSVDAINHVTLLGDALASLVEANPLLMGHPSGAWSRRVLSVDALKTVTAEVHGILSDMAEDTTGSHIRFSGGKLPEGLLVGLMGLQLELSKYVGTLNVELQSMREREPERSERHLSHNRALCEAITRVEELCDAGVGCQNNLMRLLVDAPGQAKWLDVGKLVLESVPLSGARFLRKSLWEPAEGNCQVAMVSATLKDTSGFVRYLEESGLAQDTRTATMASVFDYKKSTLRVADMRFTPKFAEREKYNAELVEALPGFITAGEAALVLCTSWMQLRLLTPALRARFGHQAVLAQGETGMQELIARHSKAVASGRGSILVGVASLAEGLDLAGELCTHVLVTSLPFASPASPLEEEIAEQLGNDYFAKRSLPQATRRLIQATGRLVRREEDQGLVTVFDRRLADTRYGKQMLHALPAFTRQLRAPLALAA